MIYWKNGNVDNRKVMYQYQDKYRNTHVWVQNGPDSYEECMLSTYDSIGGWDDPIEGEVLADRFVFDSTEEERALFFRWYFNRWYKGAAGYKAKPGMVCKVVKGYKVTKGTTFVVTGTTEVRTDYYGRMYTTYLQGTDMAGRRVSVNSHNCVIEDILDKSLSCVMK